MFLLSLPAAARVAVRHLSVKRLWAPGPAAADMTKVRGSGSPRGRRESRAHGGRGEAAVSRASEPSRRHRLKRKYLAFAELGFGSRLREAADPPVFY